MPLIESCRAFVATAASCDLAGQIAGALRAIRERLAERILRIKVQTARGAPAKLEDQRFIGRVAIEIVCQELRVTWVWRRGGIAAQIGQCRRARRRIIAVL